MAKNNPEKFTLILGTSNTFTDQLPTLHAVREVHTALTPKIFNSAPCRPSESNEWWDA